jgi:hypothetical protein
MDDPLCMDQGSWNELLRDKIDYIDELRIQIRALYGYIDKAPHTKDCAKTLALTGWSQVDCDCWKAAASGKIPATELRKYGNIKLTPEQVIKIRSLHSCGSTQQQLATRFGVGTSAIGSIVRGETWKELL